MSSHLFKKVIGNVTYFLQLDIDNGPQRTDDEGKPRYTGNKTIALAFAKRSNNPIYINIANKNVKNADSALYHQIVQILEGSDVRMDSAVIVHNPYVYTVSNMTTGDGFLENVLKTELEKIGFEVKITPAFSPLGNTNGRGK